MLKSCEARKEKMKGELLSKTKQCEIYFSVPNLELHYTKSKKQRSQFDISGFVYSLSGFPYSVRCFYYIHLEGFLFHKISIIFSS